MSKMEHLCAACSSAQPEFICFCAEMRLCSACLALHLLAQPTLSHKPLPLASRNLIQSFRQQLEAAKVDQDGQTRKRSIIEREMKRLSSFESEALTELQRLKVRAEAEVARTVAEAAHRLHEEISKVREALVRALGDLSEQSPGPAASALDLRLESMNTEEDLLELFCDLKPLDLGAYLRQTIGIRCSMLDPRPEPLRLYKFFGGSNSVVIFDVEKERYERLGVGSEKFLHNASWCLTASGQVMLTGGSFTGHSRCNAVLYTPWTNEVEDLEPMAMARRCHASVFYEGGCFVFGGVLDEERLSLCERYDWEQHEWRTQGQMKERRAYLGCAVFQDLILLCGGCENSSYEVMNPSTREFTLVPLPQAGIQDVASAVTVGESVLIFHGNFNGEVSCLYPRSSQVTKKARLCYGNSWSSCSPVVLQDWVYMLRSDSIFKYSLNSHTSAYVLRMTGKRKD